MGLKDRDTPGYDILGVGFGPSNIALAAALQEEAPQLRCRFLETRPEVEWQPGMLLARADIQNNPLRDLVTLRDPRSRYTFINYLHEQGRLVEYLNLPLTFPLRKDYARYIRWVAGQLGEMVDYHRRVTSVDIDDTPAPHYLVQTADGHTYRSRALVLGTGRSPYVPEVFTSLVGDRVFHSSEYLWRLAKWNGRPLTSVAVIGASQSAGEIALDLHSTRPDIVVSAVMRTFGYRLKDTSAFSEEAFFPDFIDYYHGLPHAHKADLDAQLRPTNYSSIDRDVVDELYVRRYEDQIDGRNRLQLQRNRDVTAARLTPDGVELSLRERHTGERTTLVVDLVVVATGYRDLGSSERAERFPPLLAPIADAFVTDDMGAIRVERDYRVPPTAERPQVPPLFLNGLCEASHGLGDAGSFSLLALRAQTLRTALTQALAASPTAVSAPSPTGLTRPGIVAPTGQG